MAKSKKDIRKPGRPSNPISRSSIVTIARNVFASAGYAGASLQKIAEKTGLRKASLYHHFSSKEALYLAVLDTLVEDLSTIFAQALVNEGSFVARLEIAATAALNYLADNADAAQILVREMMDGGPFVEAHGQSAILTALETGAQFFSLGIEAGDFREQDPRQLMISVMGLVLHSYAAMGITNKFLGYELASKEGRIRRNEALSLQIRALCCS
tara:strand:- start:64 stop:702 length:639 start_codon:yes stop_codon:yes gene_type:complete